MSYFLTYELEIAADSFKTSVFAITSTSLFFWSVLKIQNISKSATTRTASERIQAMIINSVLSSSDPIPTAIQAKSARLSGKTNSRSAICPHVTDL